MHAYYHMYMLATETGRNRLDIVLTNTSFPTVSTDVYASRKTLSAFLIISSPLTVMSFASPNPRPTKYSI